MAGQVPTRRVADDQVLLREEALGSSVVPCREVNLSQPEGVFVVFCIYFVSFKTVQKQRWVVRVKASSLSPMKMAESYWCLLRASWRQARKNFSITDVRAFVFAVQADDNDHEDSQRDAWETKAKKFVGGEFVVLTWKSR